MIVCHCTGISDADIHGAIDWMRAADPDTIITPGKVLVRTKLPEKEMMRVRTGMACEVTPAARPKSSTMRMKATEIRKRNSRKSART